MDSMMSGVETIKANGGVILAQSYHNTPSIYNYFDKKMGSVNTDDQLYPLCTNVSTTANIKYLSTMSRILGITELAELQIKGENRISVK